MTATLDYSEFLKRVWAAEDAAAKECGRALTAVENHDVIRRVLDAVKKEHGIEGQLGSEKECDEWYWAEMGVIEVRPEEAEETARQIASGTFNGRVCYDHFFDD